MNITNNVSWITDRELDLLKANAALPFSLGGFSSLDNILSTLKVDVEIEAGVIEVPESPISKRILEHWEREAERLKMRLKSDADSDERYQEAIRNIEELNHDKLRNNHKHIARGTYDAKEHVIKLYPDEMRRRYDGSRLDELLVTTFAHEVMHVYFDRKGFGKYPFVYYVEETLAVFGMLLFLHEVGCSYYQWAYDDVKSKRTCYRYGAMLMDQHLKEGADSPTRRYLEKYPIGLSPYEMPSVNRADGTIRLPLRGRLSPPITIGEYRFQPQWEHVYKNPPTYYFDEPSGTLCLDGEWGKTWISNAEFSIKGVLKPFSMSVKNLYLGPNFYTDDISHQVYPIHICPVYVSPRNMDYAEINHIPVYKRDNKPLLDTCGRGLYRIGRNKKWGVIDMDFNEVIPCKYDTLWRFGRSGLIKVGLNQGNGYYLYGLIDRQDVVQIPIVYEEIRTNPNNTYTVKKDGEEYDIDKSGNRVK